jgi:hypothetical protein
MDARRSGVCDSVASRDDVEPWPASLTVDLTSRLPVDPAASVVDPDQDSGWSVLCTTADDSRSLTEAVDGLWGSSEVATVELDETSSTLTASDDVEEAGEDTSQLSDVEVT